MYMYVHVHVRTTVCMVAESFTFVKRPTVVDKDFPHQKSEKWVIAQRK